MKRLGIILAICMAVTLTGCDQAFQSSSERDLAAAKKKFAQKEYAEAVLLYEAALDGTPATAEVHYKLALIYEDKIKSPVSAIHHFQRYLEMAPKGSHAKEAQKFLTEDQLKLSAALGNGATISQEEAKRIKNANLELQKKNLELKDELETANKAKAAAYKAMGGKNGGIKPEQTQKPLLPDVRTYTVEPGDTFASIANKFYKNKGRWQKIQDANFSSVEGTAKIKPGMVLMVP